jgi:hypothetical protein
MAASCCAVCSAAMVLKLVKPDPSGGALELRTYVCAGCGHSQTYSVDGGDKLMGDLVQPDLQLGTIVKLTKFAVDDSAHNSDGLLLHGWDGEQPVTGFISRRVMDDWVDPRQPYRGRQSLIANSTTRSASATSQRSSESSPPNISEARRSIAGTRLSIFCCPTSWKAKRRSIRANWCANRGLPLSSGCHVRIVI